MTTAKRHKHHITITNENLSQFSSDVAALWATPIVETDEIPSPITFLRDYVSLSKPLLIHNAFPIISLDEIIDGEKSSDHDDIKLYVDTTPDGHGDCTRSVNKDRIFVMPQVKEMSLEDLRIGLRKQQKRERSTSTWDKDENGLRTFGDENEAHIHNSEDQILYYSRQNDCLRSELPSVAKLFPQSIPFADETFDSKPDAVNLWVGNERSVSSMHKDHYENIFCVAQGEKIFTICPPSDALFLNERNLPSGTFRKDQFKGWVVDRQMVEEDGNPKDQMVRWIESDVELVLPPTSEEDREAYLKKYPLLEYAHPMRIHVKAGDMLYLPSLWYHRVTQTCETVAVNYWYDMRFDSPSWCHFNFMQHIHNHETH